MSFNVVKKFNVERISFKQHHGRYANLNRVFQIIPDVKIKAFVACYSRSMGTKFAGSFTRIVGKKLDQ